MATDLKISWDIDWFEDDLPYEEYLQATTAIGEFTDSAITFEWFRSRGYTLYQRNMEYVCEGRPLPGDFYPRLPCDRSGQADYPFPHYNLQPDLADNREIIQSRIGKIWYAQDAQGRHVVLKLVPEGSDELRVCEFIRGQPLETLERACVLPVLDILAVPGYRFVIMPKWGVSILDPQPKKLQEMMEILHSMLKALDFLHSHNIVHRDISEANILVNHCSGVGPFDAIRKRLRSSGKLTYALFDFDMAVVFPPQAQRSKCRLPIANAFQGTWPQPHWDRSPGTLDYDPFAFDVGCLGLLFRQWIQNFTGDIPFLAPLLDRMTTKASARFTARDALRFFEKHVNEVFPANLAKPYRLIYSDLPIEEFDLWGALSADEAAVWASDRVKPSPFQEIGNLVGEGEISVMSLEQPAKLVSAPVDEGVGRTSDTRS